MGCDPRTDSRDLLTMSGGSSARAIAERVLVRVEKDRAFAAAALDAEIARVSIDARERGFATELSYGALRVLPWLYAQMDRHAKKSVTKLDPRTKAPLAICAYQLFFTRVAAFAAVNECVDSVRTANGPRVAAFANAVLRKVAKDAETLRANANDHSRLIDEAIAASAAPWLRDALARALGEEGARSFLTESSPPTGIRLENAGDREAWLTRLREAAPNATFEVAKVSPIAILARGAGRVASLVGYADGAWSIQEEGSQLIALSLGAREGETVLDACAGRGNKTAVLARAVGANGAADAADLHPSKLERLREELARIHLAPRATFAVDWTIGGGDIDEMYDRVLVDAPCSGIGTLRRRPDLQTRRTEEDLTSLASMQLAIASRASDRVRSGGHFVYAVCSVLIEEAEEVVARLLESKSDLKPAPFDSEAARAIAGDSSTMRLLPYIHGTDGYFVASFRKR
jgi:16S rRNA (cytosine967-C5)-methyltransferase